MNIKSDADKTNFVTDKKTNTPDNATTFFWILTLGFGGFMIWIALTHPIVSGLIAIIVFFIGLNRVDAAIDYFREIKGMKKIDEE